MFRPRFFAGLPYLGAIAIVATATLIRFVADPILQTRQPFAVFFLAVVITVRYCGFVPSLLTLFLSALSGRYFFLTPRGSFFVSGLDQEAGFAFFILFGLFLALLMQKERRARQESNRQALIALQKQQELEREITERKQIEAELRASQDRFHSFVDSGPFLAFMKDEAGRYIYVNKLCQKNWGMESAHWIGRTDYDLFSKDIADQYLENDHRAMKDGCFVHFDETAMTPDGLRQNWSTTKFPIQGENGLRLLGGISLDVTEACKAEQAARDSEARLLLALEAGRMGIWSWDLATNRVQSSETQALIHGRSAEQTETQIDDSDSNIHPDDREIVRNAIKRAIANEAAERVTYRVVWPGGSIHWVEAVGRVFCDESGKPNHVMGVCADITERKRAENALTESEERFRQLAMHAPVGIAQSDAEGRTFFVNPKWCELAGAVPEESMVYGWQKFLHPDDRQRLIESWQADMAAGKMHSTTEFRFIRKDGSIRWASSTASQIHDSNGIPIGQIGVTVDVTERRMAEIALKSEQELLRNLIEVQEKEKQFLCHEFHDGLIQYAFGSVMLLESCRSNPLALDNASKLDTVIANLRRGVEDGRRVIRGIRPAVLDDSGLEAAMEDLVGQYETSGIHVTCKCSQQIGRLPETIQTTVYRVVQEALNNAAKYSGTDVVRIELKKIDGELHLEVRDFGCGFDVPVARKKGFGLLGMTERVRLLGGECLIESQHDIGTTISVRLPIPSGR